MLEIFDEISIVHEILAFFVENFNCIYSIIPHCLSLEFLVPIPGFTVMISGSEIDNLLDILLKSFIGTININLSHTSRFDVLNLSTELRQKFRFPEMNLRYQKACDDSIFTIVNELTKNATIKVYIFSFFFCC